MKMMINQQFRRLSKNVSRKIPCTLVPGDGVGPELVGAVQKIFTSLNIPIIFEKVDYVGQDNAMPKVLDSIRKNRIALVGTIGKIVDTPTDELSYSNIRMRQSLDLYANVVHTKSFPGIKCRHENLDIYLMREHTEGEYSTLEHEPVKGIVECLKITTRKKSLRIAKFAFDFALRHNRKAVTAVHKANIIKMGDGMFLSCCQEVSKLYPRIKFSDLIIDNATMQMTSRPQQFDILVMQNLYGSILDNICSGITGGAGVTPGASYSPHLAVFQPGARHTFIDARGKNIANPIAMILCSVNLLHHVNLHSHGSILQMAVTKVLAEGKVLTSDLGGSASTDDFTSAVITKAKAISSSGEKIISTH